MTRKERLNLNELSVKAFGNSSKWTKLVNRGTVKNLVRTLEDGTLQKYKGLQRFTVEEIVTTMTDLIVTKEKEEAEKKLKVEQELTIQKAKQQEALNTMVQEGEKLGLYENQDG